MNQLLVRPAAIGLALPTRYVELHGWLNLVQRSSPTTVSVLFRKDQSWRDQYDFGTRLTTDNYFRFAFPVNNPRMLQTIVENVVLNPNFTDPTTTLSGTIEIFAMVEDWDHTALHWDNKPEPLAENLLAKRTLTDIEVIEPSDTLSYGSSNILDATEVGLVYGLCLRNRITSAPLATHAQDIQRTSELGLLTTQAKRTGTITRRSSSGTTRTLIFADGHGLHADMKIDGAYGGFPFKVLGVNGDDAAAYNTAIPEGSSFFRPLTIADANTLTYSASPSLSESETDSTGQIEYW